MLWLLDQWGGRRLKATLMLKSLLTWSGTTLRARAHGITIPCVNGRRWSKKQRGEVKRSMLAKSSKSALRKGVNFKRETLFASLRGGLCFRGTTLKTKMLSKLYSLNLDRPLPPWKLPKPSMRMELCLVTAPNNPMGDRHIPSIIQGNQDMGTPSKVSLAERLGLKV